VEVVVGTESCVPPEGGSAVTIGAYDGVHLGHRRLLGELIGRAGKLGVESVVVTFDRHPATVVRPESSPAILTDLDQKLELLEAVGIDRVLLIPFDEKRANEPAEEFVEEVLVRALRARVVVVGENFHFGYNRRGNVGLLSLIGERAGFEVLGLALQPDDQGEPISSTRVRRLLAAGDVAGAAELLGRFHQVRGHVVRGDGRGGPVLGFPTANVELPVELAVPAEGIYACCYERPDRSRHQAAVSIGRRPTFYESAETPLLEAYLIDFSGDLYGEEARISFIARLRDDRRFESPRALAEQMQRDVEDARKALAGHCC
jgi:riboflavin kinase/FMN adenylyltransferase